MSLLCMGRVGYVSQQAEILLEVSGRFLQYISAGSPDGLLFWHVTGCSRYFQSWLGLAVMDAQQFLASSHTDTTLAPCYLNPVTYAQNRARGGWCEGTEKGKDEAKLLRKMCDDDVSWQIPFQKAGSGE